MQQAILVRIIVLVELPKIAAGKMMSGKIVHILKIYSTVICGH
jgi:hypothetical protein